MDNLTKKLKITIGSVRFEGAKAFKSNGLK